MPIQSLALLQWDEILFDEVSIYALLVNLALDLVLAHVLAWHYVRYANVLSNKRKFARVFVFISMTTLLVISVVKTSLALSLGLVGALSIVRFRTPIKEPLELAYLFLAIALGIGLGAGERVITVCVFAVLIAYLTLTRMGGAGDTNLRTVLDVSVPAADDGDLETLSATIRAGCSKVDLRRIDRDGDELHAGYLIEIASPDAAGSLVQAVRDALPSARVHLIERDSLE
jgi:hypothetical protein